MEETERPRKVQKVDHNTSNSMGNGADLSTSDDKTPSQNETQLVQDQPSQDKTANGHCDKEDETAVSHADNTAGGGNGDDTAIPLSKNQLKKKRRLEQWEAGREFRKAKKKEKLTEKKARKRAEREQESRNPTETAENGLSETARARNAKQRQSHTLLPLTFVIDCGYDGLMFDKERTSLASQLTRSYSDNSRAPYGAHLMISSFNGFLKERFNGPLGKTHERWKGVNFLEEDYMAAAEAAKSQMSAPDGGEMAGIFSKHAGTNPGEGEIVYLTSDSPDTLTELKPYTTYIVGGLVDRNRHKGICYKSAMDKGIKTAKLPIGDYMKMNSRFVLATNHVVEIMLKWLELGDWGEAFIQVMPKRKGGELKGKEDEATSEKEAEKSKEEAEEESSDDKVDKGTNKKAIDTADDN